MFRLLAFLGAAVCALALSAAPASDSSTQKIRILVAYYDDTPFVVSLLTQMDVGRAGVFGAAGGALGGIVAGGLSENRNVRLARLLGEEIGSRFDRHPELESSLRKAFSEKTTRFELTYFDAAKAAGLIDREYHKPEYQALPEDRWDYMILLEESAGFATPVPQFGKLMPASQARARIFDLERKKRVFNGLATGVSGTPLPWEDALAEPQALLDHYGAATFGMATNLYAQLLGSDTLHAMAAHSTFAEEFPSIKKAFKKYSKSFRLKPAKLKGWQRLPTLNKYRTTLAPKKEVNTLSLTTEVDLLIEEIGQDFPSFQDYIDFRLNRIAESGMDLASLAPAPSLPLEQDWIGYQIDDHRGGILIVLFRQDGPFALSQTISILHEEPHALFAARQTEIATAINQTEFSYKAKKLPR